MQPGQPETPETHRNDEGHREQQRNLPEAVPKPSTTSPPSRAVRAEPFLEAAVIVVEPTPPNSGYMKPASAAPTVTTVPMT